MAEPDELDIGSVDARRGLSRWVAVAGVGAGVGLELELERNERSWRR